MNLTDPKISKLFAADMGRRGGRQRANNLTPERRKEIAVKAAQTRWANRDTRKNTQFLNP